MKKSNEKPYINCDEIERLLIDRIFDELTQDESHLVREHLKSCDRCQGYQNTLVNLQNSMQISAEDKLTPNPAIRQNIMKRMKISKPAETGIFNISWHYIKNVFEYRIPVYQALFGVVLIALTFLAVKQISFSPHQKPSKLQSLAQIETSIPAQMSVIENLEIIEGQKIGRNVKEDTTLTRFIFTAM
jgi:hypothetical protein